jgi:hypothetical protein
MGEVSELSVGELLQVVLAERAHVGGDPAGEFLALDVAPMLRLALQKEDGGREVTRGESGTVLA